MDVERILRNTPSTLSVIFYGDASPVDADGAVTVTITKPDGSVLVNNAGTSHGPALSGKYSYNLAPQVDLRQLKVNWTGLFSGVSATLTTFVEIVGGFYFTLYEARNSDPVIAGNSVKYTNDMLEEGRLFVETEFERICKRAFVPRGAYETFAGTNSPYLILENPEITRVTSLKVDGVDWTSKVFNYDLTRTLQIVDGNYFPSSIYGESNISIEYEYGQIAVPADIKRAALKRLRSVVIGSTGRIDERATMMTVPEFGAFSLATPGMRGSFTGLPEVDFTLNNWIWAGGVSFG